MSAGASTQAQQGFLIGLLRSLGGIANSPQKRVLIAAIVAILIVGVKQARQKGPQSLNNNSKENKRNSKGKGNVDAVFWKRVWKLIQHVIPSWSSPEIKQLIFLSILLIFRTMMSIWLADVNGRIVKAIVEKDFQLFLKRIFNLFLFAVPSSTINSGIDYLNLKLALRFRKRLTTHFHKEYLRNMHYYKICNLDSRIMNPDQRLTNDSEKWARSLSNLYLNLSKPILDIVLFSRKLAELVGWQGPAMTFAWYAVSGFIIRLISPPFGRLTAIEQKLEGEYRSLHTELLGHSEEIAFYNGHEWERKNIDAGFDKLYKHVSYVLGRRFMMGIYDSMLVKYGAVMIGYTVVGLPVFGPNSEEYLKQFGDDQAQITKDYVRNSSLLINLAKAIGRLVVSYKEVQSLAGYTTLIYEMDEVLGDLKQGKYKRVMVNQNETDPSQVSQDATVASVRGGAQIIKSDNIQFKDVPILSPNGDILVEKMNFEIKPGMHLMITGPNGCGKSSLFRILGELWPATGGQVFKPDIESIFYIPQRPYLPNGTLRDQLIYPDLPEMQKKKKITDDDLHKILYEVKLGYLVGREGGWEKENDWNDVLSGGEKQRVAMARLIYHKPAYAILDECTSAVSIDVEGHLYTYMKEQGITLITVSHRETLWKYHDHVLKFTGDRQYTFGPMPEDKKL